MDEYITRNNAISAACFGCNQQFSDKPCEPSECTIRQSIMALPTADVAPKSEVEKLHEVIFKKEDLMQKIAKERNDYYDELQYAKQEVAREIFEEIDSFFARYDNDKNYFMDNMEYDIAELKKKYTGEQI